MAITRPKVSDTMIMVEVEVEEETEEEEAVVEEATTTIKERADMIIVAEVATKIEEEEVTTTTITTGVEAVMMVVMASTIVKGVDLITVMASKEGGKTLDRVEEDTGVVDKSRDKEKHSPRRILVEIKNQND